jgi:tetratricopeptide (TPR) repeat protein
MRAVSGASDGIAAHFCEFSSHRLREAEGGPVLTNVRRACALVLFLSMLAAPTAGQTLTGRLVDDARDGRLDEFSFIAAALIASGVEDQAELDRWLASYAPLRSELLAAIGRPPGGQRIGRLHAEMKEQLLLGRYDEAASDVRIALNRGDFNCLSLAAMALDLCELAQWNVQLCLTRGHVALRFTDDNSPTATGGRRLTPAEMLGKFYYNRGIERLKQQRFAEGIALLETSLQLDPYDEDARANIAAGFNNWAVDCLRAKRLAEAAGLIDRGLQFDPALAPLIANERLLQAALRD